MIRSPIGVQTKGFVQPIKKALHTAARLGCDGVQIDARQELRPAELSETGLRQLRKMLVDLNLRVGSVAFPTRRGYADPNDLGRRIDATLDAMQLASRLESRILVCHLGNVPDDPAASQWATLSDVLTSLSAHGNRLGVQLAARVTVSGPEVLADFISTLPEGTLALDLHPAKLIDQGQSPAEFVAAVGQHIAHVHAADGVRDLATGHGVEVQLGRGSADFPELLGMLEEFEYRGWLTIEPCNSAQAVDDVADAVQYLRAL